MRFDVFVKYMVASMNSQKPDITSCIDSMRHY